MALSNSKVLKRSLSFVKKEINFFNPEDKSHTVLLRTNIFVDIVVLDFPLLDTRNRVNGITGKFISDLVLQILSYVAQVERENTKQRQAEGIRIAKERGIRLGRPPKSIPEEFKEIYSLWKDNKISKRKGALMLHTNHNTFSSWIRNYEKSIENNNDKCEQK